MRSIPRSCPPGRTQEALGHDRDVLIRPPYSSLSLPTLSRSLITEDEVYLVLGMIMTGQVSLRKNGFVGGGEGRCRPLVHLRAEHPVCALSLAMAYRRNPKAVSQGKSGIVAR